MAQFRGASAPARSAVMQAENRKSTRQLFDRGRYAGIQTHADLLALAVGIRNRLAQRLSTQAVLRLYFVVVADQNLIHLALGNPEDTAARPGALVNPSSFLFIDDQRTQTGGLRRRCPAISMRSAIVFTSILTVIIRIL